MSLLKICSLLPVTLFIGACSAIPTASLTQIQKTSNEISCQDLQNPAYQQAVLNTINQIRQQSRQCGQQYFPATKLLSWSNNLYKGALSHSEDMAAHNFLGQWNQHVQESCVLPYLHYEKEHLYINYYSNSAVSLQGNTADHIGVIAGGSD